MRMASYGVPRLFLVTALLFSLAAGLATANSACAQGQVELSSELRAKLYALGFPRYINPEPSITQQRRDLDAVVSWRVSNGRSNRPDPLTPEEIKLIETQPLPAEFGALIGRPSITNYGRVAKFPSRKAAEEAATGECQRLGGGDGCGRGAVVPGGWCVGYAAMPDDKGNIGKSGLIDFDPDPNVAKQKAVDNCKRRVTANLASICQPIVALCGDGRD